MIHMQSRPEFFLHFESPQMVVNSVEQDSAPSSLPDSSPPSVLRRKRTWWGLVRDICLYVMIYIVVSGLSIGPFFWSWHGAVYADGPKWIARFYQPLAFLCDICPPLSWVINEWVNRWIL